MFEPSDGDSFGGQCYISVSRQDVRITNMLGRLVLLVYIEVELETLAQKRQIKISVYMSLQSVFKLSNDIIDAFEELKKVLCFKQAASGHIYARQWQHLNYFHLQTKLLIWIHKSEFLL